jgi:hypothetical protein
VEVEDLIEAGVECGCEGAGGGGLAATDFAGRQAGGLVIDQKLQPGLDLGSKLAKRTTVCCRGSH